MAAGPMEDREFFLKRLHMNCGCMTVESGKVLSGIVKEIQNRTYIKTELAMEYYFYGLQTCLKSLRTL